MKKTQPQLKCHYEFISAKNIIFIASDDMYVYFESEISKYGLHYIPPPAKNRIK